jgi:hypothetical protein
MNNAVFLTILFLSASILGLFCLVIGSMITGVPDSYPSDRRKYRIKEIVRNDGTSVYYIQYKWFIIWRTYKARQRTEVYEYHVKDVKLEYKDINNAYAKITQLISERNNIDSKKKYKTKYHYYFN